MLGGQLLCRRLLVGRRPLGRLLAANGRGKPQGRILKASNSDDSSDAVPEIGWMWQPAGGGANRAGATRANLKQANIKAKK